MGGRGASSGAFRGSKDGTILGGSRVKLNPTFGMRGDLAQGITAIRSWKLPRMGTGT